MIERLIKFLAVSAVFTALFACSSEPSQVPAELVDIDRPVPVERVWHTDVGSGDNELRLQFEPFISGQTIYTVDVDGELNALDRQSGKEVWSRDLNQRISGGISGDSQRLYVSSFQGELIALSRENGSELWRSALSSESLSVAASDGATVVAHSSDGRMFAFSTSDGEQLWRYDSETPILSIRGTSSPVIRENTVLVGLATGELVALNLVDGRKLWDVDLAVPSGRTELERLVDSDGEFVELYGVLFATAFQGELKAIDPVSGAEAWNKPLSSLTGVAASREFEMLVSGDADGVVVAVEAMSGKEMWRSEELLYRRLGRIAILEGYALVSDFEGYIHFFDLSDGEIAARVRPDRDGVMGRVNVADNVAYVYTRSGDLYAYQLEKDSD